MANDLKIQEGHPIDENLRPVKVNGEETSLELSDKKSGKGVRVSGDLQVTSGVIGDSITTGEITSYKISPPSGLEFTVQGASSQNVNIKSTLGDIKFHPSTGSVDLTDTSGNDLIQMEVVADPSITVHSDADQADYLKIETVANGATTIETVDADASLANLSIKADGSITLNSLNGKFILQNAGTEFSVADSSYSGMILGYRCKGEDATPVTYTLTTSFAVINAIAGKVSFKAPPSGNVEVEFQVHYYGGNGGTVSFGLSDNSTYNAIGANYECISFDVARFDDAIVKQSFVVTGLSPGTTYEYWLGAKVSSTSGTPTLKYGGDSTNENVPLIIKVIALPEAVSDFAVFG